MVQPKILIVEDDVDIVEMLKYPLEQANFEVDAVYDGQAAINAITEQKPDLILLDLMLPNISGVEVYRTISRNPQVENIPVIMVTAKSEEIDRIVGLELGADDYIVKPFSPREVVLRVQAVLRRLASQAVEENGSWITVQDIQIDIDKRKVLCCNQEVELTATEFELLVTLTKSPGRVFSRSILMNQVWGQDYYGVDRTVDTHMSRLRRKLNSCGEMIQTVHGVGYRLQS